VISSFNARSGLIIAHAELFGPSGSIVLRLALDTGATATMVNVGPLTAVGYDPSLVVGRVQVTTGSGVEYVPRIEVSRIKALGQERISFPILSHTLLPSAGIDGLLGLDFLRGQELTIALVKGRMLLG
jgi:predicted aspartyl protease